MTKFETLCHLCGIAPESKEAEAISEFVNEMLFHDTIRYSDEEIFSAATKKFRKPNIQTVYNFIVFFDMDGEAQNRYVTASSEEEATEKLEAHFRELEKQGFQYPCFITNPTVEVDYVIV